MRHLLLKRLLKANSTEKISMSLGGWKVDARSGRKEIAKTIEGFRKEGERRRSYVALSLVLFFLLTTSQGKSKPRGQEIE
jgi:hypothetical protein